MDSLNAAKDGLDMKKNLNVHCKHINRSDEVISSKALEASGQSKIAKVSLSDRRR